MAKSPKPAEEPETQSAGAVERAVEATVIAEPSPESARDEAIADAEVIEEALRPEPKPQPVPPAQPAPAPRRSGSVLGPIIGGVLAAAAGFGLAQVVPQGWPIGNTTELQALIDEQTAQIETLGAQLADLAARPAPDAAAEVAALRAEMEDRLAALPAAADPSAALAELRGTLDQAMAALDGRLTALESMPAGPGGGVSPAQVSALQAEIQSLRDQMGAAAAGTGPVAEELQQLAAETKAQIDAASAEAQRLREEAAAAAQAALAQSALGRVEAALEAGGPYAGALADLSESGIEAPAALAESAATGVPTLAELQRTFPDAARAALEAALRANMGEGWTDRLTAFLRTQTGIRSIEPREGDDPDAVLSRAEAVLSAGDLPAALAELSALPEAAQAALAPWLADAQRRMAATEAVAALAAAADSE